MLLQHCQVGHHGGLQLGPELDVGRLLDRAMVGQLTAGRHDRLRGEADRLEVAVVHGAVVVVVVHDVVVVVVMVLVTASEALITGRDAVARPDGGGRRRRRRRARRL